MLSNPSTSLSNRDLIKEYMARTRAPPPIFKPSFIAISPPPSQLDAIAYTHPRLLMNNLDHELDYIDINLDAALQYIDDDNSIELLDASKNVIKSSPKIVDELCGKPPRSQKSQHRQAFASIVTGKQPESYDNKIDDVACKLIGKVNPTLVKTWQQLNRKFVPIERPTTTRKRTTSNSSDDRILYPEADPKTMNISTSALNSRDAEPYRINVVRHSESSEDFYDSIDADDEHFLCNVDDVPSMCADGEYLTTAAGEVMADDLLDKRKICWSIDSESRFSYKKDVS